MQTPDSNTESPETEPAQAELPFEARVLNQILFGRAGLRAVWRVVLFLVGFALLAAITEIALTLVTGHLVIAAQPHRLTAWFLMRSELDSVIGMMGGLIAVMLVCRQSLRDYFFVDRMGWFRFAMGVVAGFAALTVLLATMMAMHFARASSAGSGAGRQSAAQTLAQGLLWGCGFLLVALFEEGTFRCFLLRTLETGFGGAARGARVWWIAAVLSSLVFGGIHWSNHGESLVGIGSAAGIGFVFCCMIRWTGSVWWAVGFHAAWDWAQTFFYGTADSGMVPTSHWLTTTVIGPARWTGGATGPEGSVLIFPLLVLILIGSYAVYGRGGKTNAAQAPPGRAC